MRNLVQYFGAVGYCTPELVIDALVRWDCVDAINEYVFHGSRAYDSGGSL